MQNSTKKDSPQRSLSPETNVKGRMSPSQYKEILKNYREDPTAQIYYGLLDYSDESRTQHDTVGITQDANSRVQEQVGK